MAAGTSALPSEWHDALCVMSCKHVHTLILYSPAWRFRSRHGEGVRQNEGRRRRRERITKPMVISSFLLEKNTIQLSDVDILLFVYECVCVRVCVCVWVRESLCVLRPKSSMTPAFVNKGNLSNILKCLTSALLHMQQNYITDKGNK